MNRKAINLLLLCLIVTPATATTIDELIAKYGKKPILESIYKKSGKRAHIKTDDGIKLFNLPDPSFTDSRTIQRDLEMINMTPDQIELDIQSNQQKILAEQSQINDLYQHYQNLPPEPTRPLTPTITPDTSHQILIIPRYSKRKSGNHGVSGYGKGCGSKSGPGGSRLPNGKCPSYR